MKKFKTKLLCVLLIFSFHTSESHPLGTTNQIGNETTWGERLKVNSYFNPSQVRYGENAVLHFFNDEKLKESRLFFQSQYYAPQFLTVSLSNVSVRSLSHDNVLPSTVMIPGKVELPISLLLTNYHMFSLYKEKRQASFGNKPSPFLKWLGLGAFWWAAFFDHYQDAIQDNHVRGLKTYIFGADTRNWHFIKDLAHLGYLATGFAAGMELGQKKVTVKRLAIRMVGSVMIYWFIQNIVYDKARFDVWFDYERKYKTDSIVVFDLKGRDHRIPLSKWTRPLLDVVRVVGGLYLVIKY